MPLRPNNPAPPPPPPPPPPAPPPVSTVIRAIALKQISWRDVRWVVLMESTAGVFMGAALGLVILVGSTVVESVGPRVGATVFVSLPLVALWANLLGAFLPLVSAWGVPGECIGAMAV